MVQLFNPRCCGLWEFRCTCHTVTGDCDSEVPAGSQYASSGVADYHIMWHVATFSPRKRQIPGDTRPNFFSAT